MKGKVIIADFVEYNDKTSKLGNYHYCNCFVNEGYEALWMSNSYNRLIYFKDKQDYDFKKSISSAERHEIAPRIFGFSAYSTRLYGNYMFSKDPRILLNNEKYIKPDVRNTLRQMDFEEADVLWISNPKLYWLTNVVKYKRLVYRIADDLSHFKEYPGISLVDKALIDKADHVFVTAANLVGNVKRRGKEPTVLSNGVLFDHFHTPRAEKPAELKDASTKKIIYVGAIKYWFDVQLIKRMAHQVKAEIYLIGKPDADLSELEVLPNVHILGARPYDSIPSYLQNCDVAIIPFIKSSITDSVSPIKLYEYCSAGIPVVCSNMEEVKRIDAPIYVAEDDDDFIKGVNQCLEDNYDKAALIEFGRNNSWQMRFELAMDLIRG